MRVTSEERKVQGEGTQKDALTFTFTKLFKNIWAILIYLAGLAITAGLGAYVSKLIK